GCCNAPPSEDGLCCIEHKRASLRTATFIEGEVTCDAKEIRSQGADRLPARCVRAGANEDFLRDILGEIRVKQCRRVGNDHWSVATLQLDDALLVATSYERHQLRIRGVARMEWWARRCSGSGGE